MVRNRRHFNLWKTNLVMKVYSLLTLKLNQLLIFNFKPDYFSIDSTVVNPY